ncbi:MAG: putative transcriptional regulator [Halorubrum sp. J07HR59]|jgi:Predicted transcriptional regulators|nr:MAG: putative transcriptional regulator [Halorubrum sp. J07HR59]
MVSLQDLGLSDYESQAYQSLLNTGASTASELSEASEVPMGRIYDVLNRLEARSVTISQQGSRPKRYVAVEPETAVERVLKAKKEELRERRERYEQIAAELPSQLKSQATIGSKFWDVAVGPGPSGDLLLERLAAADTSILIVFGGPAVTLSPGEFNKRAVAQLQNALDKGVTVQCLVSPDMKGYFPDGDSDNSVHTLFEYSKFSMRESSAVGVTTNIIDTRELCVQMPDPLNPDKAIAMVNFENPGLSADISDAFEPTWEAAEQITAASFD